MAIRQAALERRLRHCQLLQRGEWEDRSLAFKKSLKGFAGLPNGLSKDGGKHWKAGKKIKTTDHVPAPVNPSAGRTRGDRAPSGRAGGEVSDARDRRWSPVLPAILPEWHAGWHQQRPLG